MSLMPDVSPSLIAFLRIGTGILTLLTLLMAVPNWRWFFVSEKWGGYAQSGPEVNLTQNPVSSYLALGLWCGVLVLLTLDRWTIAAAAVNLVLCHYFFIHMRWKSLLRGMGAPGFLSYWLAAAVFLLELCARHAPGLRPLAVLTLQEDMAMIMFTAGVSKMNSGYVHNNGMELGMVNPMWGYGWKLFIKISPGNFLFKVLNHLGWSVEIVSALLMLVPLPGARLAGGFGILASFVFVATQIRLGVLCQMVMLGCVVFIQAGGLPDLWLGALTGGHTSLQAIPEAAGAGGALSFVLAVFLWTYLVLRPLSVLGLFYNFYGKAKLPAPLQRALELWTNAFGIILWRVFTADLTNFFVEIHEEAADGSGRRSLSHYDRPFDLRFNTVAEAIAIASVFTTLKYFPGNSTLFTEKLLRYAKTLPCPEGRVLAFRYVGVIKSNGRFAHVPVVEYRVDPRAGRILSETQLSDAVNIRAAAAHSSLHAGTVPGSYAPSRS